SLSFFLLSCSCLHLHLPSFPTRRSSDLASSNWSRQPNVISHPFVDTSAAFSCGTDVPNTAGNTCPAVNIPVVRLSYQSNESSIRSEEHTSELQSRENLVCRLLLEKKKNK